MSRSRYFLTAASTAGSKMSKNESSAVLVMPMNALTALTVVKAIGLGPSRLPCPACLLRHYRNVAAWALGYFVDLRLQIAEPIGLVTQRAFDSGVRVQRAEHCGHLSHSERF